MTNLKVLQVHLNMLHLKYQKKNMTIGVTYGLQVYVCMYFCVVNHRFLVKKMRKYFKKISEAKQDFHHSEFKEVSQEAKNLINRILKKNPNERPTLEEILEDPWFKTKSSGNEIIINNEVLSRLKK